MLSASFRSIFCAGTALMLFSGCAGYPTLKPFFKTFGLGGVPQALEAPPDKAPETYWKGDGVSGPPTILVRIGQQRAYFYRGRKIVAATRISTGKQGFGTPAGSYNVIQKDKNHVSNMYGDFVDESGSVVQANVDAKKNTAPAGTSFRGAKMPYFLRFSGGHGLHAGRVPNYPASHGCVRLPVEMARHFFENAEMGTPVRVED
jgi:lipoprotein-anchoring transpeptidase ErfK/SrfK